jgi:hypothetical protein
MVGKPHEENTKSKSFCRSSVKNDSLVEQAAEQLAILLWRTWLYNKKRREEGEKNEKSS